MPHYERALAGGLEVDWVEVITENFFGGGGRPRAVLEAVRRDRPIVFHGVSLGVGSLGPPDAGYLRRVNELARAYEPAWISDHVCWTRCDGRESHELLPLPFTEEALAVAVDNTLRAEDALGRPLVLENASSYVRHAASQLTEWEFLSALAERSGCSLLLDLNNVAVSAYNHGFSPEEFLAGLPPQKVVQFHLANHSQYPHHKFDDHRGPVPDAVWALYEAALLRFGSVASLVEWDDEIPSWQRLVAERDEAAARARRVLGARASGCWAGVAEAPSSSGPLEARPSLAARPAVNAPRLEAQQRLFFAALAWPTGVSDFAASRDGAGRRELEQSFEAAPGTGALARLDLYANAYFHRQLDALRDTFPRLARLAGDVAFHDLVTDYVLECPSDDPDLHRRGERLPAFVRAHALGRENPPLGDVAELELGVAQALDAPDAEPLARADLARCAASDWPGLELSLVPSVRLVGRDERWLVFRRGHRVDWRALEPDEALALSTVSQGVRFEALCERIGARGVGPGAILAWLERWLEDGLLRRPPAAS